MLMRITRPTIQDLMKQEGVLGDDQAPSNKAELARLMADLYEHQSDRRAAPLPNFDKFINALARPRWEWTPKAEKIFRRISRIRNPARTVRDILQASKAHVKKRPAFRRRSNWGEPATSESSVSECTMESIDVCSDAPTACTPSSAGR